MSATDVAQSMSLGTGSVRRVTGDELLAGLNRSQIEAVTAAGGPVVVLAGAGSGKTRVLTRRIARRIIEGDTDPNRVIALTFTRKAATELRHRLTALGLRDQPAAGTIHGMAMLQLRRRWAERGITPPTLISRKARFISGLLPRQSRPSRSARTAGPSGSSGSARSGGTGGSGKIELADVVAEIEWARARLVGPDDYDAAASAAGRTSPLPPGQLGELLVRYQQEKQRRRVVDFDDLLMLAIRDLRADQSFADAIRWCWRHLYIDEFQDVNPLQFEMLAEWRGGRDDLFVVGDPNQAIYGWNGADPGLLGNFARREPSATVIELADNYRSTPQIVSLASTLASGRSRLQAHRGDGPHPTITDHADDRAEAEAIADRARQAYSVAGSWSDQAILVRTNAQLLLIEQALADAGIPARTKGGAGPLTTPEVRTELKLLSRPGTDLTKAATDLHDRLGQPTSSASSPSSASSWSPSSSPPMTVQEIERRANLAAFARLLDDYLAVDAAPTGPGFAAWVGTLQPGDVEPGADGKLDAVTLATFHGSKGLEWPVVHVAGLEDGFVPIAYASTGAQLAEERRLLYVALTRARDELHLTWAAERTFGAATVKRQPSPHLEPLASAIAKQGVAPSVRTNWRAGMAKSRHSLSKATSKRSPTNPAGPDSAALPSNPEQWAAVYQALCQWRHRKALAADITDNAVLNDHLLRLIATVRPTTSAELAAVPGLGWSKLNRYRGELTGVIAEAMAVAVVEVSSPPDSGPHR